MLYLFLSLIGILSHKPEKTEEGPSASGSGGSPGTQSSEDVFLSVGIHHPPSTSPTCPLPLPLLNHLLRSLPPPPASQPCSPRLYPSSELFSPPPRLPHPLSIHYSLFPGALEPTAQVSHPLSMDPVCIRAAAAVTNKRPQTQGLSDQGHVLPDSLGGRDLNIRAGCPRGGGAGAKTWRRVDGELCVRGGELSLQHGDQGEGTSGRSDGRERKGEIGQTVRGRLGKDIEGRVR